MFGTRFEKIKWGQVFRGVEYVLLYIDILTIKYLVNVGLNFYFLILNKYKRLQDKLMYNELVI